MHRWFDRLDRCPEGRWLLMLGVLAVALRAGWWATISDREPKFDEIIYLSLAERLAAGQGYVEASGEPANFWPVGYPAVLAAALQLGGRPYATGIVLQTMLGALTCVLVSTIGRQAFGNITGRLGGLLEAIYPTHIFYSTLLLGESLFTLLLVSAIGLLMASFRGSMLMTLLAGTAIGCAALVRPVILPLASLLPFWYYTNGITRAQSVARTTLVVLGMAMVLTPWLIRNHRYFGTWTEVSSNGGFNFLLGNHTESLGGYFHWSGFDERFASEGKKDWSIGYRLGWEAIQSDPAGTFRRLAQKLTYFVALETDGVLWNLKGLSESASPTRMLTLLAVANIAYVGLLGACVLGLLGPPVGRPFKTLFVTTSVCLIGGTLIFIGDPRFHFPLVPLAGLIGVHAALTDGPEQTRLLSLRDPQARRLLFRWAAILSLLSLLMGWNLWLKMLETRMTLRTQARSRDQILLGIRTRVVAEHGSSFPRVAPLDSASVRGSPGALPVFLGTDSMLPAGLPAPLQPFCRSWPSAQPTVHPTTPFDIAEPDNPRSRSSSYAANLSLVFSSAFLVMSQRSLIAFSPLGPRSRRTTSRRDFGRPRLLPLSPGFHGRPPQAARPPFAPAATRDHN
jgi:hypothetical protein